MWRIGVTGSPLRCATADSGQIIWPAANKLLSEIETNPRIAPPEASLEALRLHRLKAFEIITSEITDQPAASSSRSGKCESQRGAHTARKAEAQIRVCLHKRVPPLG